MSTTGINALSATIQHATQKLGPIPNEEDGDKIREVMSSGNVIKFVSLGACLEDCLRENSYGNLSAYLKKRNL